MLPYVHGVAFRSEATDPGNPLKVVSPHRKPPARIGNIATDGRGGTGDDLTASRIQKQGDRG